MSQIDRRNFFFTAGAGVAAGSVARLSANDRIRTGFWGTQHGHTTGKLKALLDSSDFEVVGIHEPDEATRTRCQAEPLFQGLRWVSEEELLADSSIDLVVVECWIWEAIPRGDRVIESGKHLHLEKPPAPDLARFRALVEKARRKKLLLQMGYVLRFHPSLEAAFEAARKGWLGDVYQLRGTINKDLEPERRAQWARYRGGTMFELGGHVIDRMVDFFGRPKRVQPFLRNDTLRDGLADNTVAVLEFETGVATAYSSAVMAGSGRHRSVEVIGTDGSFIVQPFEPGDRATVIMREARGPYQQGQHIVEFPPHRRYVGDFAELARALKGGKPLRYDYDYELTLHETLMRASGEMS